MLHIQMASRNLREKMDGPENDFRQKPIRVVEDNGKPGRERRREEREQTAGQNEKRDGNDDQVRQERNRRDQVIIPKHERQRTNPGRERNGAGSRHPQERAMKKTAAGIKQTARQKRIGCEKAAEKSESGIGQKHDGRHDRERKLESDREKLVRFPAKDQGRRGGEAVERENFSFHQKSGEQHAAHDGRTQA